MKDNIPLCIKVAKSIASLYHATEIPNNHFELQADLYYLINNSTRFSSCHAELRTGDGRIDIFFVVSGTTVVIEVKHFSSASNVEAALKQILEKQYYKVFKEEITGKKVLMGIFMADDGKVSVGCLVDIDCAKCNLDIMKGRVCGDSKGSTLFLNVEVENMKS